jgi:hypothetical protein
VAKTLKESKFCDDEEKENNNLALKTEKGIT